MANEAASEFGLSGRTYIVTGAGRGLGRAMALAIAAAGGGILIVAIAALGYPLTRLFQRAIPGT